MVDAHTLTTNTTKAIFAGSLSALDPVGKKLRAVR